MPALRGTTQLVTHHLNLVEHRPRHDALVLERVLLAFAPDFEILIASQENRQGCFDLRVIVLLRVEHLDLRVAHVPAVGCFRPIRL